MLEQLLIELQNYPERMLAKSKEQFRDYLITKATNLGLPTQVLPQSRLAKNVVVGNLEQAKVILGAHYDTAPRMFSWMMNHMVLFNIILVVLMWVALPLIIVFMPIEVAFVVYLAFMGLLFGYMLGFFSIPNKHNINDNTSGVLTLLSLMHEVKSKEVAFVFFDNEEKGLIGSMVLAQYLRKLNLRKRFIILDCVGVGDTFAFYHYRSKHFAEEVQSSFTNLDHHRFNHEVKKGGYLATSDHLSFQQYANVGIMAMQRKNGRLVINNIHCEQDCYLDLENIEHAKQGIKNIWENIMEFSNKLNNKHDGLLFFTSFGYLFVGSVLFLIPLVLILSYTDPSFVITRDYFESNDFLIKSMLAEGASKILLIVFFLFIFFSELKENVMRTFKELIPSIVYIVSGIIIMLVLLKVLSSVYQYFGIEGDSQNQDILIQATNSPIKPFMFFMIVVFAPFVEEIIFRKLLFGFCEKTLKLSKWWAFAISTFVFAFIHVMTDINSYIFIFQYLVLSGVITLSYVLSRKNIVVPMGIHFLNNLLSYLEIVL